MTAPRHMARPRSFPLRGWFIPRMSPGDAEELADWLTRVYTSDDVKGAENRSQDASEGGTE